MTQLQRIKQALIGGRRAHIRELHEETGILRPNIRRLLGVGARNGEFERLAEGVYALATAAGEVKAYVQCGASEQSLHELAAAGVRFDSIFLDPAYFSRALVGGSRGIKSYSFIHLPEFTRMMQAVRQLVRTPDSHVYLMLSGAPSAQQEMAGYQQAALRAGFTLVGEGRYQKLFGNGQPVTNVRGKRAAAERLLLLTVSGEARAGELADLQLDFEVVRPPIRQSYVTEKAPALLQRIVQQSTFAGEWVLDAFAGSGVTGEQCLLLNRFSVLIEQLESTIFNYIMPRLAAVRLPRPQLTLW